MQKQGLIWLYFIWGFPQTLNVIYVSSLVPADRAVVSVDGRRRRRRSVVPAVVPAPRGRAAPEI